MKYNGCGCIKLYLKSRYVVLNETKLIILMCTLIIIKNIFKVNYYTFFILAIITYSINDTDKNS